MKKIIFLCVMSCVLFFACSSSKEEACKSTFIDEGDFKFLRIEGTHDHPDLYLLVNKDGSYTGTQYSYTTSNGKSSTTHIGVIETTSEQNNQKVSVKSDISVDDAILIIQNYLSEINNSELSTSEKLKKLSITFDKLNDLSTEAYQLKNETYKTFITQ